jgi:hypothetical protein
MAARATKTAAKLMVDKMGGWLGVLLGEERVHIDL